MEDEDCEAVREITLVPKDPTSENEKVTKIERHNIYSSDSGKTNKTKKSIV